MRRMFSVLVTDRFVFHVPQPGGRLTSVVRFHEVSRIGFGTRSRLGHDVLQPAIRGDLLSHLHLIWLSCQRNNRRPYRNSGYGGSGNAFGGLTKEGAATLAFGGRGRAAKYFVGRADLCRTSCAGRTTAWRGSCSMVKSRSLHDAGLGGENIKRGCYLAEGGGSMMLNVYYE